MPCKDKEKQKEYQKKWYAEHRDEVLSRQKQYKEEHKDEISARYKKWYAEHRDEKLAYCKKWHETHRDERKKYREQNKDRYRQWIKAWEKNHREQRREIRRKSNSKRERDLGFIPLNEPFEGAEAHHICRTFVIYIPKEYHKSVSHNVWTGEGMPLINAIAYDYLFQTKTFKTSEGK